MPNDEEVQLTFLSAAQPRTFTTIGGETVVVKTRGKHYVEPRGYAMPPGTGPQGETCAGCEHYERMGRSKKRWAKCAIRTGKTHGRGTDILAGSPACSKWMRATDWSRE